MSHILQFPPAACKRSTFARVRVIKAQQAQKLAFSGFHHGNASFIHMIEPIEMKRTMDRYMRPMGLERLVLRARLTFEYRRADNEITDRRKIDLHQ